MAAPTIDYSEKIPNNVDLASDRRLQRALESWQPKFLQWWRDLGPVAFQDHDVYLRTAISTDQEGWANFGFVKMPEYRWGIFLAGQDPNRTIAFGDNMGKPVWQDIPGEHRADLRRLIVVQGDTEPASVEQQRRLCETAPSCAGSSSCRGTPSRPRSSSSGTSARRHRASTTCGTSSR